MSKGSDPINPLTVQAARKFLDEAGYYTIDKARVREYYTEVMYSKHEADAFKDDFLAYQRFKATVAVGRKAAEEAAHVVEVEREPGELPYDTEALRVEMMVILPEGAE